MSRNQRQAEEKFTVLRTPLFLFFADPQFFPRELPLITGLSDLGLSPYLLFQAQQAADRGNITC